jgi:integrase
MKINYSAPKTYTGGVDISRWSSLSTSQQKDALSKSWYVYYSFRDPKTGKLKRQTNIKGDANKYQTKRERYAYLKLLQGSLLDMLEAGFNPYGDNTEVEQKMFGTPAVKKQKEIEKPTPVPIEIPKPKKAPIVLIKDVFEKGLLLKKNMMNKNSFNGYKSRILRFEKWLKAEKLLKADISSITKKVVIEYLNSVLITTSPRNRNNTRTDISSLFQLLEDNEFIEDNFVRKINILKSKPKRNKTFTPKQLKDLYNYVEEKDQQLLLFIKFVSYNFLRPIEVGRLRIEDIDIKDKKLYVKAKNSPVKIKRIPDKLLKDIPDLSEFDPKSFLFIHNGIGGEWNIEDTSKRDYFSKKFKNIKDHFKLGEDYGIYSFRHTFITMLCRELRQKQSPFEAKSNLMLITGHTTMVALTQYLRDIDAELPDDYSDLFDN